MKIGNFVIYIMVFFIIFASFKIPDILLKFEDYEIQGEICDKKKRDIDFKVEEIYLVRAIYDIESESNTVLISQSKEENIVEFSYKNNENRDEILQEILNLQEYNIIKGFIVKDNSKVTIRMMDKIYKKHDDEYIIKDISLEANNIKCKFDIERKSGKIISIFFDKKNLSSKLDSKKVLTNYINYLGLDIINDWTFQNNMMKSGKAKLVASLVQSEDFYLLSIHSNDKLSNAGNLYNFVTK